MSGTTAKQARFKDPAEHLKMVISNFNSILGDLEKYLGYKDMCTSYGLIVML